MVFFMDDRLRVPHDVDHFESRGQLRDSLVHEELHHRWWNRGLMNHHPGYGEGTSDRFYATITRYFKMRGWPKP
ncbi:hypothetical protein [Streptomyces sp. NPDC093707]|uniref:hypothetical protein n=1 Tax=Streptomyces sp. NPDC093707 TaxID=3154984 RepID=UPI00344C6C25